MLRTLTSCWNTYRREFRTWSYVKCAQRVDIWHRAIQLLVVTSQSLQPSKPLKRADRSFQQLGPVSSCSLALALHTA
jgi:hypothetical protein